MKIILDLPDELLEQIRKVSPNINVLNFIRMAIENQISLENEPYVGFFEEISKNNITKGIPIDEKSPQKSLQKPRITTGQEIIPYVDFSKLSPIKMHYPIKNTIIWGQYNKFFPIKFGLRFLSSKLEKNSINMINLNDFQLECAQKASQMKKILLNIDEKENRKRGEKFSAGLPDNTDKSQYRFISQVLGFRTAKGDPVGGIPTLGFAEIKENSIGITQFGLDFVKIKNPILDINNKSTELLSLDEREFLINHIKTHLPKEAQAIKLVLNAISQRKNTPELLNIELSKFDDIGEQANTIRTGILARIHDLGLIEREKNGIHSFYKLTKYGIEMRDSL